MRASDSCLIAALVAAAATATAGDVYVARDARGRAVLTNTRAARDSRAFRGGSLSVASPPGRMPVVPQATAFAPRPIPAEKRARYVDHIASAAARYMLSPRLIEAVIAVESDFRADAVSRKGAQGLMQLMPDTARHLAVGDPFDPRENIHGGARYLRAMLDEFNQNLTLALAAYNAGPTTVRTAGGIPRIAETEDYVRKVRSYLGGAGLPRPATSLVARRDRDGRVVVTNLPARGKPVRLERDRRGGVSLTNR